MHASIYVCMHVYTCVCVYIYICIYTYVCVCVCVRIYMRGDISCMHTYNDS